MKTEQFMAGNLADSLIATEVAIQDRMWGDANDRADAQGNQLLKAAQAQSELALLKIEGCTAQFAVENAQDLYPKDWNGFRDYGSHIANLVVAAAFIRSEIKRRVLLGESTYRAPREQAYAGPDMPNMSSEQALADMKTTPHHPV
jgi:hypothetical protein